MEELFLKALNMSITASWLILAIIIIRILFKKAPKWLNVALWGFVAIRLISPSSIESVLSLIPSAETVPEEILYSSSPAIHSGIPYLNYTVNPVISETLSPTVESSINPIQTITFIASIIWLIGIAAMLLYGIISYTLIYRRVREAVKDSDGIFICDRIPSPFILGIIKPKIYLPSSITESDKEYVIAHEKAHLKRLDHLWKPFGFLLLSFHWFNPLIFVAYILLCRDIELACDQKVIAEMGTDIKKSYSEALINCSAQKRLVSACPLAFGETSVKSRVKSILSYKKPALYIIIIAVIIGIVTASCFLTNPKENKPQSLHVLSSGSELDGISLKITDIEHSSPAPYIEIEWKNETANDIIYGDEFYIYRKNENGFEDCRMDNEYYYNSIAYYIIPHSESTKKYSLTRLIMTTPDTYRFESNFMLEGSTDKYKIWIEFELKTGVEAISVHSFSTVELVYYDPMYSFVQTAGTAPDYRLVNGMQLQEISNDGIVTMLGTLEETTISRERFDARFRKLGWQDGYSVSKIKKNSKRMWQLYRNKNELYIFIEQTDGSHYLGYGYYNTDSQSETMNSDNSHIRWLYRLEKGQNIGGSVTEQIADDGALYFYSEPTDEYDFGSISYKSYIKLNEQELGKILKNLDFQKWVADALVDRTSFTYNGQLKYKEHWLYFGYEQKIIYYDEYFCTVSDSIMNYIKDFEKKAEEFIPTKLATKVYVYNSPLELEFLKPSILLFEDTKTFQFNFSSLSSYIAKGSYELDSKRLTLKTEDGKNKYIFNITENGFTFDEAASSKLPKYKYSANGEALSPVPDGAFFTQNPETSYYSAVSYAGYSDSTELYTASLNSNKLYINHTKHLPIKKFDTLEELNRFKEKFKNVLQMDKGFEELQSFNHSTKGYNNDFFKENTLFLVYVAAPSTSYRYGVKEIYNDKKSFSVSVERTDKNETGNTAMSGWFITISVKKSDVSTCSEFDAYMTN